MDKLFELAARLDRVGIFITRMGVVVVLVWIGGLKVFAYEDEGIVPFVANSPFMNFSYRAPAGEYRSNWLDKTLAHSAHYRHVRPVKRIWAVNRVSSGPQHLGRATKPRSGPHFTKPAGSSQPVFPQAASSSSLNGPDGVPRLLLHPQPQTYHQHQRPSERTSCSSYS